MTRWLITGASGQLGAYVLRHLRQRGESDVHGWTGQTDGTLFGYALRAVPLTDGERVRSELLRLLPDAIVHCGAVSRIDACHESPELATQVNHHATCYLAEWARGVRFIYCSTDLVFDGDSAPYRESDRPRPRSHYGRTKHDAEQSVLEHADGLVVRLALMYGPNLQGRPTLLDRQCEALRAGQPIRLFRDEYRTPLSLATAASALVAAAESPHRGLVHVGGPERLSRWDMGQRLAAYLGACEDLLVPTSPDGLFPEPRPRDVSLDSTRWRSWFPHHPWPTMDEELPVLLAPPSRK